MTIQLSRGQVALIDDADAELCDGRGWQCAMNHRNGHYYAYRRDLGARTEPRQLRYLHRLILERVLRRPLCAGEQVDHANGNTLDNRRGNLRLATRRQNQSNMRRIRSATGYKGVVRSGSRFAAFCGIAGGPRFLGSFETPELAAEAYDLAATQRRGEFAATNAELVQ